MELHLSFEEAIIQGSLYIVSTPIGNLGDITVRALHVLNEVDMIAAEDTRVTGILLKKYEIRKFQVSFNSFNQAKKIPELIDKLKSGKSIALVSDAGTPGINDPAYNLVKECISESIRVIPIPGASAFIAALVTSGLPGNRFVYEGFLPIKKGRQTRIAELAEEHRTLVFYESPHRIRKTVEQLLAVFGNRSCSMARELTKKFEEIYYGDLHELTDRLSSANIKGEIVLIVAGKTSV